MQVVQTSTGKVFEGTLVKTNKKGHQKVMFGEWCMELWFDAKGDSKPLAQERSGKFKLV
ncbi:gp47 [Alphaproteobacteria phage PhiJL001]|uniref:Gp47 n=1 Tax=Alphaproteobacteria phage PhiJL001 TaxID=2681607 RepID=Q5DN58_9CAUD|nr:gp47 [Alphaproteobacteria phage PhiJL001]AAT69523.1 gp47 [Alphaproteobacteria phage PhiJL001]